MKVLRKMNDSVWVYYYGIELYVPPRGHIVTNSNGIVFWCLNLPRKLSRFWLTQPGDLPLLEVDLEEDDWEKSCRNVQELIKEWEDDEC